MLKYNKIYLVSILWILLSVPHFLAGGEIDSLKALLTDTHDATKKIEIYTELAQKYKDVDFIEASAFAHEALTLSDRTGNKEFLSEIYAMLGDIAVVQDSLDLARDYYLTALKINESHDDTKEMTGLLLVLGNIAFVQDNLAAALNYYHRAVESANETGQDSFLDNLYLNIGSIHFRMQNNQVAQEYFTRALESFTRFGDSLSIAAAYSNLGLTYVELENYGTAEEYFSNALKIYLTLKIFTSVASTYVSLADAESKQNNYEQANDFLLNALEFSQQKDLAYKGPKQILLSVIYENLGTNYIALNEFGKADHYLSKAYKLALINGQIETASIAAKGLAIIYERNNRLDSALYYHKVFKTYSDSMLNVENIKSMTYQNARFEYEQYKVENELRREKEIEKQKRNKLIFIFIIAGLVMLLLVLVLLLKLGRNRVKRVELEQESLKKELELRNKELTTHVLYQVKNNEFILNLSKKLKIALSKIPPENRKQVNDVIREIETDSSQETWKDFEMRFQNVHTDFYKKLSKQYPDLTSNELRVCAFLKLNMSTKDIAAITYQTTNSITVARWRLRQKFGLEKDENLVSFLSQF